MKYLNKLIILLIAILLTNVSFGQSVKDLRFNEILIKNDNNFDDEYGRHVPWIEIFNSAYNTVNLAGCYLTDDTTGFAAAGIKGGSIPTHWYRIPKTDINTALAQRSFVVFYMDAQPLYGTFHVNFDPRTSKTDYVALISGDGKDLIDLMHYPKSTLLDTCLSFGFEKDGINRDGKGKKAKAINPVILDQFTPGSTNEIKVTVSKQEKLKQDDPYGIGLAFISMSVVFTALVIIYLMLKLFGYSSRKISAKNSQKTEAPAAPTAATTTTKEEKTEQITGEEAAAIAAALHLHFNSMHDEESEVITIEMPSAHYSPWAQKELTMKKNPRFRR